MTVVPELPTVEVPAHLEAIQELIDLRERAQQISAAIQNAQQQLVQMNERALLLAGAIAAYEITNGNKPVNDDESASPEDEP